MKVVLFCPLNCPVKVVLLPHPTQGNRLFSIGKTLCVLSNLKKSHSTWCINDDLVSSTAVLTPFHLGYVLLPLLMTYKQSYCSVESILHSDACPDLGLTSLCDGFKSAIECLSDSQDVGDELYYRFNETKALNWIRLRIQTLYDSLDKMEYTRKASLNSKESKFRLVFGLMSDLVEPRVLSLLEGEYLEKNDENVEYFVAPVKRSRTEPGPKPAKKVPKKTEAPRGVKPLTHFFAKK